MRIRVNPPVAIVDFENKDILRDLSFDVLTACKVHWLRLPIIHTTPLKLKGNIPPSTFHNTVVHPLFGNTNYFAIYINHWSHKITK